MSAEPQESGMEELLRLSKKTSQMEADVARRAEERSAREKKRRENQQIVTGLKELKVGVALGQLKPVATPEVIRAVSALKTTPGSRALRDLILDLTAELEAAVNKKDTSPDMAVLEGSIKTLAILIELLFSIE